MSPHIRFTLRHVFRIFNCVCCGLNMTSLWSRGVLFWFREPSCTQHHSFGSRPVLSTSFAFAAPALPSAAVRHSQPHTFSVASSFFGLMTSLRMTPMPESLADSKAPSYPLRNLLWRWWVAEEVILLYTADRPHASLYTEANYEAKIETAVFSLDKFKDDELEAARLRTAWGVARAQLVKTFEQAKQGGHGADNPDLDAPLSASEEKERSQTFSEAYPGWVFEAEDMPVKAILGRTWREFNGSSRSVTVVPLKRFRAEAELVTDRARGNVVPCVCPRTALWRLGARAC